jgi:hypothetical protein
MDGISRRWDEVSTVALSRKPPSRSIVWATKQNSAIVLHNVGGFSEFPQLTIQKSREQQAHGWG